MRSFFSKFNLELILIELGELDQVLMVIGAAAVQFTSLRGWQMSGRKAKRLDLIASASLIKWIHSFNSLLCSRILQKRRPMYYIKYILNYNQLYGNDVVASQRILGFFGILWDSFDDLLFLIIIYDNWLHRIHLKL